MIVVDKSLFCIHTQNTSYAFQTLESGQLEHLYYGKRIHLDLVSLPALAHKQNNPNGSSVRYSEESKDYSLSDYPFEYAGLGKGDFREPSIDLLFNDQTNTTDFLYQDYLIQKGPYDLKTLPNVKGSDCETLIIKLKDRYHNVEIEQYYTVFEEEDTIARGCKLINHEEPLTLRRLMSVHLDFEDNHYRFIHFTGDWTNEMNKSDIEIKGGHYNIESRGGSSSNRANPLVFLAALNANEEYGNVYSFNLLYSGNHYEAIDVDGHSRMRFLSGINPNYLYFPVGKEESFESPQATMTFSDAGFAGTRKNTHGFITNHVLP